MKGHKATCERCSVAYQVSPCYAATTRYCSRRCLNAAALDRKNKFLAERRAAILANGAKTCTGCGERRPLDQFFKNAKSHLGRTAKCKQCMTAARDAWRRGVGKAVEIASRKRRWAGLSDDQRRLRAAYRRDRDKANPAATAARGRRARELAKARGRSPEERLTKAYIAKSLCLPVRLVPDDLIELCRAKIRLERELRNRNERH